MLGVQKLPVFSFAMMLGEQKVPVFSFAWMLDEQKLPVFSFSIILGEQNVLVFSFVWLLSEQKLPLFVLLFSLVDCTRVVGDLISNQGFSCFNVLVVIGLVLATYDCGSMLAFLQN